MLAVPTHDTKRLLLLLPVKNCSARSHTTYLSRTAHQLAFLLSWGRRAELWLGRAFVQPLKKFCLSVMLEVLHLMATPVPNTLGAALQLMLAKQEHMASCQGQRSRVSGSINPVCRMISFTKAHRIKARQFTPLALGHRALRCNICSCLI